MSRTPVRRGVGYGTDSSVVTSSNTPSSARGANSTPRAAHPPTTPRPQTTPTHTTTPSSATPRAAMNMSDSFAHHERNHSRELDEMKRVTTNMEKIHSACSGLVLSSDIALAALLNSEHSRKLIQDAGETSGSGSGGKFTSAPKVARRADTPSIPEQVRLALLDCASVGPSLDVSGRTATDTLTDILTRLQELQLSGGVSMEGSTITPPIQPSSQHHAGITRSGNTTPQLSSLVLPSLGAMVNNNNNRTDINLGASVGGTSTTPLSRALGVSLVAGDVSAGVTATHQLGREEGGQSPARHMTQRGGGGATSTQSVAIFDSSVDPNESIWPDMSSAQLALHEILLTTRNDPALRRRAPSTTNPSMSMSSISNSEESAAFQAIRASCRKAMMALYDATQGHAAVLRQRDQLALSSHTEPAPATRRTAGFIDTQSANRIGSGGGAASSSGGADYLLCVAFDRPKRLRAHLLGSVFDAMRDTFKRFLKAAISRSQTARFVSEDHEGCAFILSFTSPLECVVFDYCIQRYAMYLPWPSDVLELPYAAPVNASADYAAKAATCAGKEMDWVNDAGRRIDQRGAVFKPAAVTKSEGPLGSSAPPSRPQSPGMDNLNHSQNSLQGGSNSIRSSQSGGGSPATTSTGSFVGATTGNSFSSFEVKEIRIARAKLAAIEQMFCVQVELLNGAAEERAQQAALRAMQQEQQEAAAAAASNAHTPVEPQSAGAFPVDSPRGSLSGNTSPSASSVREASRSQLDMDDPTELSFINRPPILPAEASAAQIAAAFQAHYASYSQRGPQIRSSIHFSSVDNFTRTAPFNVPQATVSGLCGLSLDGTTLSASVIDRPDMKAALEAVGGFMWEHSFPDMEACERDRIDEYGSSASRNTKETRLLCLLDLQEFCGVYRGYTLHYHRGRQCPNLIQRQAKYKKAAAAAASSKLNNNNNAVYYPPRIDSQFYDDTINESLSPTSTTVKVRRKSSSSSTFCATHLSENPAREGISESYNPWWWCSDLPSINALTGDMGRMIALPTRSQACQTMPVQVVQLDEDGNPISVLQHRRSRARSMARGSSSPRDRKSLFSNSVTSNKSPSSRSPPTPTIPRSVKSQKNSARNTPIPEPAAVPTDAQVLELAEKLIVSRRATTADSGAQTQFGSYDQFPQSRIAKECVKELLYNPQATITNTADGGSSTGCIRSLDQIQAREAPTSYGYEGFTDTMATASSELMEWVNNENNVTATDDSIVRFVSAMLLGVPMAPRRGKINTAADTRMSGASDASSSIPPTPRGPNNNESGGSHFASLIDSTIPSIAEPNTFSTPPRHVNSDVLAYRAAVAKGGPSAIGTFLPQSSSSRASPQRQLIRVGPDPASLFRPADRGWEGVAKTYTQLLSSHSTPGTTPDDTYQRQCWGAGSANSNNQAHGISDRGTLHSTFRSEDAAVSRAVIASIFHAVSQMKEDYSRKLEYQRVVTVVALEEAQQRIHSLEERLSLCGGATATTTLPPSPRIGGGGHTANGSLGTSMTGSLLPSPAASSRPSMATPNRRVSKVGVSVDGLAKTPRPPRN